MFPLTRDSNTVPYNYLHRVHKACMLKNEVITMMHPHLSHERFLRRSVIGTFLNAFPDSQIRTLPDTLFRSSKFAFSCGHEQKRREMAPVATLLGTTNRSECATLRKREHKLMDTGPYSTEVEGHFGKLATPGQEFHGKLRDRRGV